MSRVVSVAAMLHVFVAGMVFDIAAAAVAAEQENELVELAALLQS